MIPLLAGFVIVSGLLLAGQTACAQPTVITYQGHLNDGAVAANGNYDFQFTLHDSVAGGTAVAGPLSHLAVPVTNGLFTVRLDFGSTPFSGQALWLEVGVRPAGSEGVFVPLIPRQPLTATPFAIRAGHYDGPVGATQIQGALGASNLAAGSITADKLDASVTSNLLAASHSAVAVASNTILGMFETVSAPVLVTANDTNSVWVSAGGATGFTSPQQFWRRTASLFTNASTPTTGRVLTNHGTFWAMARDGAPLLYTNATLTGQYGPASGAPPVPFVSWGTNILGTNYVPQLKQNIGAEAYAALAFKGGQSGWPPYGADERGFMLFSVDGKNWIGGTGRPLLDEPMRNGGFIRVGNAFAFGYSPHISTQVVPHVALRITTNFADWTFKTNLSAALPGETLPAHTRTWVPAQPFVVVQDKLWFFFSVSTNGSATNFVDAGHFKQRAIACPLSTFPHGWSAAYQWEFPRTNVIDFNPFFDEERQAVVGIYKDETRSINEMARFSSLDLANAQVLLDNEFPFGPFPGGEAANIVRIPGGYRCYRTLYHYDYGSMGKGHAIIYADTTNLAVGWPDMWASRAINAAADFQAFGVLRLTNHVDIQNAMAAAVGGMGLAGVVNIRGMLGEQYSGRLDRGFAFGSMTNSPDDHAGVNIGTETWTAGGWGVQRQSNQYRMDWWLADPALSSSALPYVSSYARFLLSARNHRMDFHVPLYGAGTGLSNIPPAGIVGGAATLGGANVFTGSNAFAAGLRVGGTGGPAGAGAHLSTDGTNLLVILENGAGGRTTNKVTLSPWP
jgi:hypothetical protein